MLATEGHKVFGMTGVTANPQEAMFQTGKCVDTLPALPSPINEQLRLNSTGDVVLRLKSPYQDGSTHIVMSPLEFMQRLAALVPCPRLSLIRFHGLILAWLFSRSRPLERRFAPYN
jgi:hypothetical protein